jgi:ABC-type uncharacterized transport system ATPase subunit
MWLILCKRETGRDFQNTGGVFDQQQREIEQVTQKTQRREGVARKYNACTVHLGRLKMKRGHTVATSMGNCFRMLPYTLATSGAHNLVFRNL